jgi:FkbM family methyltransferase
VPFVSHAQNFEDVMLHRALRDIQNGFYIDIGANDPELHSVTFAFYERGWRGVNVEPVEADRVRLVAKRPRDTTLGVAVGEKAGFLPFYVFPGTGLSTLSRAQAEEHIAAGLLMHECVVEVTTIADICRRWVSGEVHFLKMDIECGERDALAGADLRNFRPWIVLVEATKPNSQEPTHREWEPLLTDAAFRFVYFDGLNRFYIAEERYSDLAASFQTPPNVFDDFILAGTASALRPNPAALPVMEIAPCLDEKRRVAMTARCHDADPIPKVPDAGAVKRAADGTNVQVMHNGLEVVADGYYGSWMTELIGLCRGHHEPQEERLFHEVLVHLGPGGTMMELGGYWSYYSLWFLKAGEGRRAIIVEPDPAHLAVGKANAALNGLQPEFLSGFVGQAPSPSQTFQTEESGVIELPALTVSQIMADHEIEVLDILHCDTQGAETNVLESCTELFRDGRVRWVFVSTHALQITGDPLTHQRCLALLRDAGATIEAEHDVHESFSGDGLIVARLGPAPEGWAPVSLSRNRYSESLFRNPIYDLAARMNRFSADEAETLVTLLYETLLLRRPDPAGLRAYADMLQKSADMGTIIQYFLYSGEFRLGARKFLAHYNIEGTAAAQGELATYTVPSGPLASSGFRFTLTADGPLGPPGSTLLVPADRVLLPAVFAQAAWQPDTIEFMLEKMEEGKRYILLDIGANIGLVTRQLLYRTRSIETCLCIEPDEQNFAALSFNLGQFGRVEKRLFNHALGKTGGELEFYRDNENVGNYSLNVDAMRNRPFEVNRVRVVDANKWFRDEVPADGAILWKSDTQGSDEMIVAQTPWTVWNRVHCAIIELWRIAKQSFDVEAFRARIESFPHRAIGRKAPVSTEEVMAYLAGTDWEHNDLYLWR